MFDCQILIDPTRSPLTTKGAIDLRHVSAFADNSGLQAGAVVHLRGGQTLTIELPCSFERFAGLVMASKRLNHPCPDKAHDTGRA